MTVRHEWLIEPLEPEVRRALERLERAPGVRRMAIMPDVHLAKEVCIGTVLATEGWIYPAAVGGDAGCGVLAAQVNTSAERLRDPATAAEILAGIAQAAPIVKRRRPLPLPDGLQERTLSAPGLEREKRRTCGVQLGTVGRGNHFVELQSDEDDGLWIMIHSGSRGIGTTIRQHHDAQGQRVTGGLKALELDSPEGRDYLSDHAWALDYAQANRRTLLRGVLEVLQRVLRAQWREDSTIECHHNFVRTEMHAGVEALVHRKGAISARLGEPGIIPGSMGTPSFHVEGRGSADSLCSSSHGAGRVYSRTEARGRITPRDLARQLEGVFYDRRLAQRLVDEAPLAYKDIRRVMRAQKDLIAIRKTLHPRLVHKGA